ncbi:unnamed protein product [Closterium sp. Yama58-4]|nr:unnamed protein product [Closterium sp. Yama58-4]
MDMEDCSHHRQLLAAAAPASSFVTGSSADATDSNAAARMLPFATVPLEAVYAVAREELGRGEFGVVRTCMQRATGQLLACKSVDKARLREGNRAGDLEMELLCMGALPPHPHVVQLASVHEDACDVHLVMDLCDGGDLFDLVAKAGRLPEAFAADVFRQVVEAVAFCHSHGVLHLDVKPENILVCNNAPGTYNGSSRCGCAAPSIHVKLADFGQAIMLSPGQKAVGLAGSSFYMAPEVVCGRAYDSSADLWSLGVLLYVLLAGYVPFYGSDLPQVFLAICANEPDMTAEPWSAISPEAKHLVRCLLSVDPASRPSALHLLSHPWLARTQRVEVAASTKSPPPPLLAAEEASFLSGRTTQLTSTTDSQVAITRGPMAPPSGIFHFAAIEESAGRASSGSTGQRRRRRCHEAGGDLRRC